jgi:malate synthase
MANVARHLAGLEIRSARHAGLDQLLDSEAQEFLSSLSREFAPRVAALLQARQERQRQFDAGIRPSFLEETAWIRNSDWKVAPIPADLVDRRVEITGPVDRKMIINGLNSGANVYMADFEDANSPTWENCLEGQINLQAAVRGDIEFHGPGGKIYRLGNAPATLMVRPRGWHLEERHLWCDGRPIPAALVDFGLFFFHNARHLVQQRKRGPYFYLPKLQSHLEARVWNEVFLFAQEHLDLPRGSVRATVLIETLPAAFEMDEILYELREHSAGLNCGRWDYMFSFIKTFREHPEFVLPDRGQVTMTQPFLRAYTRLVVKTCHRRGIHAMGGMAAQIPIKNDPAANEAAMEKVAADKRREVADGHDGTWVAHPGLVPLAKEIFAGLDSGNQIGKLLEDFEASPIDLIEPPKGTRTEAGLRQNINVALQYVEAWLGGLGCVPIFNLMEDTATAEISRSQLWQWIRHGAQLEDGRAIDVPLFREILMQEFEGLRTLNGEARFQSGHYEQAARLIDELVTAPTLTDFLTIPAYDLLIRDAHQDERNPTP